MKTEGSFTKKISLTKQISGKQLNMVTFSYRNNTIAISNENGYIDNFFAKCDEVNPAVIKEDAEDLKSQLDKMIPGFLLIESDKRSLSFWMMNIYWLTKYGLIPNDDANGLLYIYEINYKIKNGPKKE